MALVLHMVLHAAGVSSSAATCVPSLVDWSSIYNSTSYATISLDPATNKTTSFSPGSDHVEHTIAAGPSPHTFTYASSETWPFVCISEPCTQCQPTLRCSSVEYTGIKIFYAEDVDQRSCQVLTASNVYQDVGGACARDSPPSCSPTLLAAKFRFLRKADA